MINSKVENISNGTKAKGSEKIKVPHNEDTKLAYLTVAKILRRIRSGNQQEKENSSSNEGKWL